MMSVRSLPPRNIARCGTGLAVRAAAVLAVALSVAAPARAETTPAQAAALEAQIRGFIARQLGAVLDASTLAVRATPAGDSVKLELPLGGAMLRGLIEASPGILTAQVKPLDGGRYAIEDMRIPSPLTLSLARTGTDKPSSMTIKLAEQTITGMLDTTLATRSNFDTRLRGYSVTVDGAEGPRTSHIDLVDGHTVWSPRGGARADVTGDLAAEKYATANALPGGGTMNISADRLTGSSKLENLDFDRLGTLVQTAAAFGASIDAAAKGDDKAKLTPAQRTMVRAMLTAFGELMDGMASNQTLESVRLTASGQTGTLKKLSFGFAGSAPGGLLEMRMPILLEGPDSPVIPQGAMREMLPKLVSLVPKFTGVPKAELMAILQRALDVEEPDTDVIQAELIEMVGKHPITVGIEKLAIELGLASLRGDGAVKVSAANNIQGDGEFRMTGLDALIRRVNTAPELKPAGPALIFLKGIGKADGRDMVWHITYADKALMVNDTNMTEMMPGK
jgi:hypothetical protein